MEDGPPPAAPAPQPVAPSPTLAGAYQPVKPHAPFATAWQKAGQSMQSTETARLTASIRYLLLKCCMCTWMLLCWIHGVQFRIFVTNVTTAVAEHKPAQEFRH